MFAGSFRYLLRGGPIIPRKPTPPRAGLRGLLSAPLQSSRERLAPLFYQASRILCGKVSAEDKGAGGGDGAVREAPRGAGPGGAARGKAPGRVLRVGLPGPRQAAGRRPRGSGRLPSRPVRALSACPQGRPQPGRGLPLSQLEEKVPRRIRRACGRGPRAGKAFVGGDPDLLC